MPALEEVSTFPTIKWLNIDLHMHLTTKSELILREVRIQQLRAIR